MMEALSPWQTHDTPQLGPQRLPLSQAQYGIWLGQQLDSSGCAYWTAEVVELRGRLDLPVMEEALHIALNECAALHQRFSADGRWQITHSGPEWALLHLDLRHKADPWAAAQQWMQADLLHPADLAKRPLFASALLQLEDERNLWYLRVHHIALDGYGYALLAQRVAALYSALVNGQALPALRGADLAQVIAEDRAYQASSAAIVDCDFWCARLQNAPAPALLATAQPLAPGVRRARSQLPAQTWQDWQAAAQLAGVDWSAWLIAAIAAWIAEQTGAEELILGLPVMGRLGSVALAVPCMVMNIVALRLHVDNNMPLAALAQQVAAEMRAIRPHQRYRYEDLKQALGICTGQRRLFGAVINLMPFDRALQFGELQAISHPVASGPVEDLAINIAPRQASNGQPGGVRLDFEANPAAYDARKLADLRASLLRALNLLSSQAHTPVTELLRVPARTGPAAILRGAALSAPAEDVLQRLQQYAQTTPHALALQDGQFKLNYAELLQAVQNLAAHLRAHSAGQSRRVALLLPRQAHTVVAMLACLWAGAAWVPLDPDGPALRIQAVLDDALPVVVLTLQKYARLVNARYRVLCLDSSQPASSPMAKPLPLHGDAAAYLMYTSGSSGKPNGVMIGRAALAQFVAAATEHYQVTAQDRILQFAPLHFDACIEEIFLALCNGASLILRDEAMLESLPRFLAACQRLQISILDLPTAFWHELVYCLDQSTANAALFPSTVRLVIIGGEAALAERVMRWRHCVAPHVVLQNTYGPTEASVVCSTAPLSGPAAVNWQGEQGDAVPIGRPLPEVDLLVMEIDGVLPVAIGVAGELCIHSKSLALAYLGNPCLVARRFVRLYHLPGAPLVYRTGDRVVLEEDGQLRYLGRLDEECKLSGTRIDPQEIETAILQFGGIREAALVLQKNENGQPYLSAFLVADQFEPSALHEFLQQRLHSAALPSQYHLLKALPRNANGKIDRKLLRETKPAAMPESAKQTGDKLSPLQQQIAAIWRDLLAVTEIHTDSDFFALGGRSLQAIQAANRLSAQLQAEIPVSLLFRQPRLAGLAQALQTLYPALAELPDQASPIQEAATAMTAQAEFAPLLHIQQVSGTAPTLFCLHPAEGLSWCYFGLCATLPHCNLIGIQAQGLSGTAPADIDAQLQSYLALILQHQPQGPYHLLGWSSGGGLAHALAARLQQHGAEVGVLALLDAYPAHIWQNQPAAQETDALSAMLDVIGAASIDEQGQTLSAAQMRALLRAPGSSLASLSEAQLQRMCDTTLHAMQLYRDLQHPQVIGDMLYFYATQRSPLQAQADWRDWQTLVTGQIHKFDIASSHNTMCAREPLAQIGQVLAQHLGVHLELTKQSKP